MTVKEFIENVRQDVREEGFMSAVKLAVRIVERARDFNPPHIDPHNILPRIACEDIIKVEYCNWTTKDYRRKDLFYYNPK